MRRITLAAMALTLVGCSHFMQIQGSGKMAKEERKLEPFHRVVADGATDVTIGVGGAQGVTVESDDNIVQHITTTVRDGVLTIATEGSFSTKIGMKVRISVPNLDAISLNGSGQVTADGVSGEALNAEINGSGSLTAKGVVKTTDLSIAGSGSMRMRELSCESSSASISGSGEIEVAPTKTLAASITGSGAIKYYGSPQVTKNVTGSGEVVQSKG